MKKITINKINEDIYYEKLDNGLDVYLYSTARDSGAYISFTTKFGAVYNEFVDETGKMIKVPNGVAHFLEHKVFVQEEGLQPDEYFGAKGTVCNAFTSLEQTTYWISVIKDVYENVNYLLDYVQSLYLTDENVESEKGIIHQEIDMCNDRANYTLFTKIRRNIIKNSPFKETVIGSKEDVSSITKEVLEKCYNTFYNPDNMLLVATGNFDVNKMLETIKKNQAGKKFKKSKIKLKEYKEPDTVVKEKEIFKFNTDLTKMAYSIKIPLNKFDMDKRVLSIYLYIIFNLLFGDTSLFDEEAKKDGIIIYPIHYEILYIGSHFIVSLWNSGDKYEELIKRIEKAFDNIEFSESDLERKKKVLISNEIFSYEDIIHVNDNIVDNIVYDGKIWDNIVDIIRSVNMKELQEIVKKIDFKNKSIVILKK